MRWGGWCGGCCRSRGGEGGQNEHGEQRDSERRTAHRGRRTEHSGRRPGGGGRNRAGQYTADSGRRTADGELRTAGQRTADRGQNTAGGDGGRGTEHGEAADSGTANGGPKTAGGAGRRGTEHGEAVHEAVHSGTANGGTAGSARRPAGGERSGKLLPPLNPAEGRRLDGMPNGASEQPAGSYQSPMAYWSRRSDRRHRVGTQRG